MRKLLIFILLSITFFSFEVDAQVKKSTDVYVKAYYRADGTYVKGYYRSAPNSTNRDNFSTKGNINPYNGKPGTIEPDNKTYYNTYSPNRNNNNVSNVDFNSFISNSSKDILKLNLQTSNIFFGVDLDYDWYTLTNLSKRTYFENEIMHQKDQPFITVPLSLETINSFNSNFRKFNFRFSVAFEKGKQQILRELSPGILYGLIEFKSYEKTFYLNRFREILTLFNDKYGPYSEYVGDNKSDGRGTYSWKLPHRQIILSFMPKYENVIELVYFKIQK